MTRKETMEKVCNWIAYTFIKTKVITKHQSSYGLKHVAEKAIGGIYISNEDFIECMILEGFDKQATDSTNINFYFNVLKKSIPVGKVKT